MSYDYELYVAREREQISITAMIATYNCSGRSATEGCHAWLLCRYLHVHDSVDIAPPGRLYCM